MRKRFMAYVPGNVVIPTGDTTPPTVPANLAASNVTGTSFDLSWSASTDAVGVTGYSVQVDGVTYANPTGTTLTVTGRTAGTGYVVRVQARDAAGNYSALSSAITVTTTASTTVNLFSTQTPASPDLTDGQGITLSTRFSTDIAGNVTGVRFYRAATAPVSVIGVLYTDAGVELARATFGTLTTGWNSVSFASPVALTAGTLYRVAYWSSGPYVASSGFFTTSLVNNHLTATGGFFAYGATPVFGTQQFGNGSYFADVQFVVTGVLPPATVPATPAAPSVGAADSSLSVSWVAPANGGSAITGYDVQSFAGATAGPVVSVAASPPVTTLTGLTNGTAYTVKVRAKNAIGNGAYSAASAAVTPAVSGAFPNATNTGPKIALVPLPANATGTGWVADATGTNIRITANNATVSGYIIPGIVDNGGSYSGLTVSNCRIKLIGEDDWGMKLDTNGTIVDCEIGGLASGVDYSRAVAVYCGPTATVLRCNIHHVIQGCRIEGGLIQDTWIHELPMGDPVYNNRNGLYETDNHSGGMMMTRGTGSIIRHNTVQGGNSACLFVQADVTDGTAVVGSLLIESNQLLNDSKNNEVSSFGIDIGRISGNVGPFTIRNNTFGRGWQVGAYATPDGATITGNVFTDGTPAQ